MTRLIEQGPLAVSAIQLPVTTDFLLGFMSFLFTSGRPLRDPGTVLKIQYVP